MKNEQKSLAIGDRVAAYYFDGRFTGKITLCPGRTESVAPSALRILGDDGLERWVHPKQLRRLVKRVRKVYWINPKFLPDEYSVALWTHPSCQVSGKTAAPGFIKVEVCRDQRARSE